jgi:hypothetical protein
MTTTQTRTAQKIIDEMVRRIVNDDDKETG